MKTIINYLKNLQLLALLGGAAFMASCNNHSNSWGVSERRQDMRELEASFRSQEQILPDAALVDAQRLGLRELQEKVGEVLDKLENNKEAIISNLKALYATIAHTKKSISSKREQQLYEAVKEVKTKIYWMNLEGLSSKDKQEYKKAIKLCQTGFEKVQNYDYSKELEDIVADLTSWLSLETLISLLGEYYHQLDSSNSEQGLQSPQQEITKYVGQAEQYLLFSNDHGLIRLFISKVQNVELKLKERLDKVKNDFFKAAEETENKPRQRRGLLKWIF